MRPHGADAASAAAVTPEQLVAYVRSVGECSASLYNGFPGYLHKGEDLSLTLTAFPPGWPVPPAEAPFAERLNAAVEEALATPRLARLTVLAPERPDAAPEDAAWATDSYLGLDLPLFAANGGAVGPQKLRNMLARPGREATFGKERWRPEHAALVEAFVACRPLSPGTRHIFRALPRYLAAAPAAVLFAARARDNGALLAFAVGDYTSLSTAFYMFAFRSPAAPPGTADALLLEVAREAEERGHSLLNLGLGINGGIRAFKHKWQAREIMPYGETSWTLRRSSGIWQRVTSLFGK